MKKTGVDRFATSGFVRFCAVVTWFVITTLAFFSRYERMSPGLTMSMAALILLVGTIGLSWAAFPAIQRAERQREESLRQGRQRKA